MAHKVLIPQDVAEEGKQYLRERGYEIKMGSGISEDILKSEVQDCSAILVRTAQLSAAVLKAGPELKAIGRHGVGYDNIDVATATELGIYVTYAPQANAQTVAEYTLGMIIALAHNFVRSDRATRAGDWEIRNRVPGIDLEGKTLGIVGYGKIGSRVARKAIAALDMKVLAYDPFVAADQMPDGARLTTDWETVFKESDFISLHLPSNEKTKGIVGKNEFSLMKQSAFLINAARGDILNEKELVEALKQGRIAGAGLDVFEKEPPDHTNELFSLENVVVTPHNAALTTECMRRMALHAAMGIDDVMSGKEPQWPVNKPKK